MVERHRGSVRKFQRTLENANGDKVKMKKAFKTITAYLDSGFASKATGQNRADYLNRNPSLKEIYEWSETVMVNENYQLFNY